MIANKYRVFCETDSKYEFVIGTAAPTSCPANGTHTIDTKQIAIAEHDLKVLDGTPVDSAIDLDTLKKMRKLAIDIRTRELIVAGFVYDSVTFSTSETAQRNWLALDQFKAFHTYPVSVTADDDSEYSFADAAAVETFVLTGMGTINSHYASGRALKIQINNAVDFAAVQAVVDNR